MQKVKTICKYEQVTDFQLRFRLQAVVDAVTFAIPDIIHLTKSNQVLCVLLAKVIALCFILGEF